MSRFTEYLPLLDSVEAAWIKGRIVPGDLDDVNDGYGIVFNNWIDDARRYCFWLDDESRERNIKILKEVMAKIESKIYDEMNGGT